MFEESNLVNSWHINSVVDASLNFDVSETPPINQGHTLPPYVQTLIPELNEIQMAPDQSTEVINNRKSPIHSLLSTKEKSRRGRKKKNHTPESLEEYTRKRMEKNRMHAKVNRQRKKDYIAKLEAEVNKYVIID